MALIGKTVRVNEVTFSDLKDMFNLMDEYYNNLNWENFEKDFCEKDWVVVLKDENDIIRGFSTLLIMDIDVDVESTTVKGVFSGDTVIHKDFWGQLDLPFIWGRFVMMTLPEFYPDNKLYWFLISKGYKTYRYLPSHFLSFYPRYDEPTPEFEKQLLDEFAKIKFKDKYDPETGLIHSDGSTDAVKEGVAQLKDHHLEDPHIKFFAEKNPDYFKGDELVCITRASFCNLKPETQNFLKGFYPEKAVSA